MPAAGEQIYEGRGCAEHHVLHFASISSEREATLFQCWPGAHNEQVDTNGFSSTGEGRVKETGLLFPFSVSQRSSTFSYSVKISLVLGGHYAKVILDLAIFPI